MRIWTRRRRFLGFEYSFTQKNNLPGNIIRLGGIFSAKAIPRSKKIRLLDRFQTSVESAYALRTKSQIKNAVNARSSKDDA